MLPSICDNIAAVLLAVLCGAWSSGAWFHEGGWIFFGCAWPTTDVILGPGRRTRPPTVKLGGCLFRQSAQCVVCRLFFLPVTVEELAKRSHNDRPARSTPWDKCNQRLDTKEEEAVRHQALSVGQVTPTRDPVFLFVFTTRVRGTQGILGDSRLYLCTTAVFFGVPGMRRLFLLAIESGDSLNHIPYLIMVASA